MSSKSPRKTVVSGPPVSLPVAGKTGPDNAVPACSEWLARHDEQETLAKHWQRLESHLIREHHWFELNKRERAFLPESAELDAIGDRLDELYALNKKLLSMLPLVAATTNHGLACKLTVALALVHPEENKDVHTLIKSVLCDFGNTAMPIGHRL